jgi:hypothetical protein
MGKGFRNKGEKESAICRGENAKREQNMVLMFLCIQDKMCNYGEY